MTTITETVNGTLFSNSLIVDGVNGGGYIELANQTTAPVTPISATTLYSTEGGITYKLPDGFMRNIQMPASGNRTYTIPNTASSSFIMTEGNANINGTITATNLSGANTGDLTLSTVGNVPNGAGATLTGQILSLQPANATFPGVVTAGTQTFAGAKTFSDTITTSGNLSLPATTSAAGSLNIAGARFVHAYGADNVFVGQFAGNYTLTGTDNVCVGTAAGVGLTTGSDNIFVGSLAGSNILTGQNNIIIGDPNATDGSNRIIIGNLLTTSAYIQGIANNIAPPLNNPRLLTIDPTDNRIYSGGSSAVLTTIPTTCALTAEGALINGANATYTWGTYSVAGGILTWTSPFNVVRIGKMVFVFLPSFMINALSANTFSFTYTSFNPPLPVAQSSTHPISQILSIIAGNSTTTTIGNAELLITGGIIIRRDSPINVFRDNGIGCGLIRPAVFIYEGA